MAASWATSREPGPEGRHAPSSFDQTGRNRDNWIVMPGEERTLADLEGPGFITHIWMTQSCRIQPGPGQIDPDGRRRADARDPQCPGRQLGGRGSRTTTGRSLLKIYWDDQETPSVIAPLGDFFGLMNSLSGSYDSLPLSVSAKEPSCTRFGGSAAFNSYFRMPFGKRARVVVENQNDIPYLQYFYIDYELVRSLCPMTPSTSTRTGGELCPTSAGGRTSRPTASRRPSRTSTVPTTTSRSKRRDVATTSAARSRCGTSRAPGGARATT